MKFHTIWGIPLALAACAPAPELVSPAALAPAADSAAQIRPTQSPGLLAGYTARAAKDPSNWRELNDQQSPAGKEDN
jgi:hypothetical protein